MPPPALAFRQLEKGMNEGRVGNSVSARLRLQELNELAAPEVGKTKRGGKGR